MSETVQGCFRCGGPRPSGSPYICDKCRPVYIAEQEEALHAKRDSAMKTTEVERAYLCPNLNNMSPIMRLARVSDLLDDFEKLEAEIAKLRVGVQRVLDCNDSDCPCGQHNGELRFLLDGGKLTTTKEQRIKIR